MTILTSSFLELIIKGIPEGLLFVYATYLLSKTAFQLKQYLLITAVFTIFVLTIRFLPIENGANSMLYIMFLMLLFIVIPKTPINKAFISVLIVSIMIGISEFLNIALLIALFGRSETFEILENTSQKILFGVPSTIIFALELILLKKFVLKDKLLAKKDHGTIITKNRKKNIDDSSL
ncbi:MAG: hypothetical protein ACC608_01390 [Anaerofustis sp.]